MLTQLIPSAKHSFEVLLTPLYPALTGNGLKTIVVQLARVKLPLGVVSS